MPSAQIVNHVPRVNVSSLHRERLDQPIALLSDINRRTAKCSTDAKESGAAVVEVKLVARNAETSGIYDRILEYDEVWSNMRRNVVNALRKATVFLTVGGRPALRVSTWFRRPFYKNNPTLGYG